MTAPGLRGTTTVSDRAVRRIAERAAAEAVPGPGTGTTKGAAGVHGRRAEVSVDVTLPYPAPLPEAVRRVQRHVITRTGRLTGLDVTSARVDVTALVPAAAQSAPPDDSHADGGPDGPPGTPGHRRTPRRWWSQRRVPTLLLVLAATVACGALAADLILVHLADRPPAAWRTGTLDWLTRHGPGDRTVTACAAAVAVLGLLMVALALAPGHRGLLTVTAPVPHLRAALDRAAVAALVRDAVAAGQGIGPVRVRARRRRVTVRAGLAFGDHAVAVEEVRHAARRALEDCGLRRAPRLRVRVRPEAAWDPDPGRATAAESGHVESGHALRPHPAEASDAVLKEARD
ncbi:DUF6286 domain-containing Asp23/Gls24 family envelope stress response protein [Streptomyces sp. NPDC006285]|uniref:DUF6286 domain-containing Asp23/Gls24 family envelope stress response protein n=1 Tax=Streptomyces sp. NPDC006285 TaxID=3364742 RepID=UPI0036CD05A4